MRQWQPVEDSCAEALPAILRHTQHDTLFCLSYVDTSQWYLFLKHIYKTQKTSPRGMPLFIDRFRLKASSIMSERLNHKAGYYHSNQSIISNPWSLKKRFRYKERIISGRRQRLTTNLQPLISSTKRFRILSHLYSPSKISHHKPLSWCIIRTDFIIHP